MSDNLTTWPENIYMQHGAEDEVADFSDCYDGVTWCVDAIHNTDVVYVRADLANTQQLCRSAHRICNLAADRIEELEHQLAEPDWNSSETLPSEIWKNPLIPITARLEVADGAISCRDKVIATLRSQIAELPAQQKVSSAVDELQNMRAVFHMSMLKAYPGKSHEEISQAIDAALQFKQPVTSAVDELQQMSELLPCPFCGAEAEYLYQEDIEYGGPFEHIGCANCKVRFPIHYHSKGLKKAELINAWNTRTPQRTAQSEDARDAARYKYLCEMKSWPEEINAAFDCSPKSIIDELIDAAIQKESGTNDGGLHYCRTCERHVSRPCTSVDCSTPDTLPTAMQKEKP